MRRLVNALLIVLIAGVAAISIALILTLRAHLREIQTPRVEGLAPGERILSAEATADRVTLVLERPGGGRRVVILDGATFRPVGSAADR